MKRMSVLFSLLAGLLASVGASGEPGISSCSIETYLTGKSSPMVGIGVGLVNEGLKYQVDPRLVVAIAGAESTFGQHICTAFNAWNWFWEGPCPASPFSSWSRGAHNLSKFLSKSFLNKGMTTIELIGARYCKDGCTHWVPNVTRFYTELGGNTANLGFSSIETAGCSGPSPNPECAPATCSTFVACEGNDANPLTCGLPVCASTAGGGGVCVEGTTQCAGLSSCTTNADCPGGGLCAVNTCCGSNVCVPRSAFCQGQ